MGLDMYAYTAPRAAITKPVDFSPDTIESVMELHYWRKHPNLHGWMHSLYVRKGGVGEDFNGDTVELTPEDLDALEEAINARSLPQTTGFFFGETSGFELADDLNFVRKARLAIASGLAVFYDSCW